MDAGTVRAVRPSVAPVPTAPGLPKSRLGVPPRGSPCCVFFALGVVTTVQIAANAALLESRSDREALDATASELWVRHNNVQGPWWAQARVAPARRGLAASRALQQQRLPPSQLHVHRGQGQCHLQPSQGLPLRWQVRTVLLDMSCGLHCVKQQ